MISAGIDVGTRATKAVLLRDHSIMARAQTTTGFDRPAAAKRALEEASRAAEVSFDSLTEVAATGAGKNAVSFAKKPVTEVVADARGSLHFFPNARTIIDVGVEEARVIKCDDAGKVVDFAMNEKCAAGAGAFIESMARALDLTMDEMGTLSLQSHNTIPLNAQCVVFAESEVVTLMHTKTDKRDIARAVHDAIASRIGSLLRMIGIENQVVFVGGLARNTGLVESLRKNIGVELLVPESPEYIGALGAALTVANEIAGK